MDFVTTYTQVSYPTDNVQDLC